MEFKYKRKVTITLQSNSFSDLMRLAAKYYSQKTYNNENNVKDKDSYVSINSTMSKIEVKS